MSTIHFTSDLHLGHEKVAALRGFASSEEHDHAVAFRWLDTVGPRDRVYVLGDVTGDSRALGKAFDLLGLLPGQKHLIAGNHDAVHPMNRNAHKRLRDYLDVFASVASTGTVKIADETVLLSHFPYTRDRAETRYPQWRLPNLGKWLLHGHTHGTERATVEGEHLHAWGQTSPVKTIFRSREIHVGLDAWDLTPVSIDTVAHLIKEHS